VCPEDDSRKGQSLTAQNMETVAKVSKLVDKEHQLTLKLMEDQLHINWEAIC
jgi:hypothetical protein